jgi:lipopolysaccharide transport system ATP-binding protein
MCSDRVIRLSGVAKRYRLFERPVDRLLTLMPGLGRHARLREFHGLRPLDLSVDTGEVVGIIGRNGAGKSTLLQLICQTLPISEGHLAVEGKVSALLELGAGFNPEFTGRENVYLSASILGMGRDEIRDRMDEILAFADIGDFIDQPVKTYSSGMFVRLAFSVATSVDPDILVVDEALSVGDGAFARKSFERIMTMKAAGKTILFCSHSLYQVEAICSRALWIEGGRLIEDGRPDAVIAHYQRFLDTGLMPGELVAPRGELASIQSAERFTEAGDTASEDAPPRAASPETGPRGYARLSRATVSVDGESGKHLAARSGESTLAIEVAFDSDPALPCPTVAVTLGTADGHMVTSAATWEDNVAIQRNGAGQGKACITFASLPLLKGHYHVGAYVFCEKGVHSYGWVDPVATLEVTQQGIEKGLCRLPHSWQTGSP